MNTTGTTVGGSYTWNGPVCPTCNATYVGAHRCSRADLARRIAELARLMDSATETRVTMKSCPCQPENGGSGVCGCILGGMTITYGNPFASLRAQ